MSTNAGEAWSAAASAYSNRIEQVTSKGGEALLNLVESLRPLDKDSIILDSGAGSGVLTKLLNQRCPETAITASDVAPGMLEQLEKCHLPNVRTMVLDATKDHVEQGLRPSSFTHALSSFMLQFISPAQSSINHTYSILQPGGVIGSAIWSQNLISEPWNTACKNLDPSYDPGESPFSQALQTTSDLEEAYQAAGFEDIKSSETEMYLTFPSAEDFADYFIYSKNPAFLMMQRTWKGKVEDIRDGLVRVTREQYDNGKIYMVAACSVARKPAEL